MKSSDELTTLVKRYLLRYLHNGKKVREQGRCISISSVVLQSVDGYMGKRREGVRVRIIKSKKMREQLHEQEYERALESNVAQ